MSMIRAVFENGVFRPLVPPDLPENSEVEFELHLLQSDKVQATPDEPYPLPRGGLIGLFADDPEAMAAVMEAVHEHRERPWRLNE